MTQDVWYKNGWTLAFFNVVVLWALNNIALGFSAQVLQANPIIYSCSTFMVSALFMLLYAGKGILVKETLRSVDTWGYGIVLLLGYILTFKLLTYVSATEASLLQRTSMIVSLLLGWFFLSRQPKLLQLLGTLCVALGIVCIGGALPSDIQVNVVLLILLSGLIQALRIFTAESHRTHKFAMANTDRKTRIRVIGFIMFVIGGLFWVLALGLSLAEHYQPGATGLQSIPSLNDFRDPASILAGMVTGLILLTPFRLIEFQAISKIKAENYLAVSSLAPIATLAWAFLLAPVLNIEVMTIDDSALYLSGGIITLGALLAAVASMKKSSSSTRDDYIYKETQDIESVEDSREILANTIEHFGGDLKQVSEALDVPQSVLEALMNDPEKVLAFKAPMLKKVARKFRKNVALSDALTGLSNRAGFMTALKTAEYESPVYSVLYIDLDKFKPVNDTYGHEAGDFVLKGVAERLRALFPTNSVSTRLGGDEFGVLLLAADKTQATAAAEKIKEDLSRPFTFADNEVSIGASLGIATFPEDGEDPETLLKHADEGMYSKKKGR